MMLFDICILMLNGKLSCQCESSVGIECPEEGAPFVDSRGALSTQ